MRWKIIATLPNDQCGSHGTMGNENNPLKHKEEEVETTQVDTIQGYNHSRSVCSTGGKEETW